MSDDTLTWINNTTDRLNTTPQKKVQKRWLGKVTEALVFLKYISNKLETRITRSNYTELANRTGQHNLTVATASNGSNYTELANRTGRQNLTVVTASDQTGKQNLGRARVAIPKDKLMLQPKIDANQTDTEQKIKLDRGVNKTDKANMKRQMGKKKTPKVTVGWF